MKPAITTWLDLPCCEADVGVRLVAFSQLRARAGAHDTFECGLCGAAITRAEMHRAEAHFYGARPRRPAYRAFGAGRFGGRWRVR